MLVQINMTFRLVRVPYFSPIYRSFLFYCTFYFIMICIYIIIVFIIVFYFISTNFYTTNSKPSVFSLPFVVFPSPLKGYLKYFKDLKSSVF